MNKNSIYEILTPTGFQSFDGIIKKQNATIRIEFSDKTDIVVTKNHRFITNDKEIIAGDVVIGAKLYQKEVVSITENGICDVYDPINVSNGNLYLSNGVVSHNCEFLGSSATLISGAKLQQLPSIPPMARLIPNSETLLQYYPPHTEHSYVMTVDVSRGVDLDYSTFTVIDISTMPYQVVCTFRDNSISTLVYPEVIYKIAKQYNDAFLLIEINDLGQQVADTLFYDFEYENVYMSKRDDIKEGGRGAVPGCRTSKRSKAIGCDMLKGLIENDKLMVNNAEIISELTTFVRIGASYKAEHGRHDDFAMCLVLFGYLTSQPVFQELFDFSLREKFFERQIKEVDDQVLPFGYLDRGESPEIHHEKTMFGNHWVENLDETWEAVFR